MSTQKCKNFESVLTEKCLKTIIKRAGLEGWQVQGHDVRPASLGIPGFLGDHFRIVLHLKNGENTHKLLLFAKTLPTINQPKAEFITELNFFRRENLVYTMLEEMSLPNDSHNWCADAYIHTDTTLVMPDLSVRGYKTVPFHQYFDINHLKVAVKSLAQFHAKFACYEAEKYKSDSFYEIHGEIFNEPSFNDSPWMRAAAKVSYNLLKKYSKTNIREEELVNLMLKACDDLAVSEDSINVVLHRDLWANNIMFKYDGEQPTNAILLDFQCLRYGPPAFDLMTLLYLTTSKKLRDAHEKEICNLYYTVFTNNLDDTVKRKLQKYNLGRWDFLNWCERARMFAMVVPMAIFPYILMEPTAAQEVFDNPETFDENVLGDRSRPVLDYARKCDVYRDRQLEVIEEFVDNYFNKNYK